MYPTRLSESTQRIQSLGKHQYQLNIGHELVILYSYDRPVAYQDRGQCARTAELPGPRSARHLRDWLPTGRAVEQQDHVAFEMNLAARIHFALSVATEQLQRLADAEKA